MNDSQVVVVEDDPNVAALISRSLEREGLAVDSAASVAAARERLARSWDLVLLDRRLPDGDGIELCREIRPRNPYSAIIIITGERTKEAKLAGFGCGADDFVTKPFAIEELVARVRRTATRDAAPLQAGRLRSDETRCCLERRRPACNRRASRPAEFDDGDQFRPLGR